MSKELQLDASGLIAVIIIVRLFPLQSRYIALQARLLRVQCLKAYYLSLLRLRFTAELFMLYAKWSKPLLHLHYLLLNRFIIHKFKKVRTIVRGI